jgi:hypothetical protein
MTPSDLLTALALDGGVGAVLFIMFLTFRASKRFRSRYWVTRLGGRQSENTRSPLVCTGSSGQQPHASELDSPLRPVAGDEPYEDDGIGPSPMGSSTGLGGGFTLLDDAPLLDSTHPADMAPGPLAWLRGVLAVSEEEVRTSKPLSRPILPRLASRLWCASARVCMLVVLGLFGP